MDHTLLEVSNLKVNSKKRASYYITLDNDNGTREIVCYLKCTQEEAHKAFNYVIDEQQKACRNSGNTVRWRRIRLFDSHDIQIDQES